MKKNILAALIVTAAPLLLLTPATLNAQQGGGGGRGGGRGAAAPANVPAPTSPVTGSSSNGKALYFSFGCYACHGYNGETGARAFVGHWGNLSTEQSFLTFLRGRANVAPVTPSTSMPNFSQNSMPDAQAKDIYAYIRTFKSTAPPNLKDAAALNAIVDAAKK
jgi:mono/diheme cytochrome c family protein